MTSPIASAESDPTKLVVDPQDPTPEPSWEFRRWYIYVGRLGIYLGIGYAMWVLAQIGPLDPDGVINALTYFVLGLITWGVIESSIYLIGPSAEQFGLWAKTVSATVQGVVFRKHGLAETAEGRVSSESVSGKPEAAEPADDLVPDQPSWKP